MIRYSFFLLCLLSGLAATAAGLAEVRGKVISYDSGEAVAGAVVQALNQSGRPISFTSTDASGLFSLPLKYGTDSVAFRSMGYESLKLPIGYDLTTVRLKSKATALKNVIVHAPDIYAKGDTLVFNVAQFARAGDNAIIDVIKRLPGVKVDADGTILYQGKPINRFYIDGNDFIGGQYGLATDNISADDVKAVEVMENHQPVKALEGIDFPEEAGINLKLKEDARSRWVGVAQAASGVQPLLYDGSLFAMRIASKIQNMFTIKADNTGWNPTTQIMEHDFQGMFSDKYEDQLWPEYISADIVSSPLNESRTRDNLSWIANGIAAWKTGDTSMRLKLNYMGDRLDYNSGISTNYMDQNIPDFIQRNTLATKSHDVSAQFNAEVNKRGYYLKNRFTANALWQRSNTNVSGTTELSQHVGRRTLSAIDDLKLVKRTDRRLFEITSRNSLVYRPDHLSIAGGMSADQDLTTTDARSVTEMKVGRMSRFWKLYVSAGADLDYHRMQTSLTGADAMNNGGTHNIFLSHLYATPNVNYERNGWRISLLIAAKWLYQNISPHHNYINVRPRLNVHRQLTAKSELNGSVSYRLGSPQPYMYITTPVLADYRNLFVAATDGRYSSSVSASISYRYRNPLNAFFANITATFNHSRTPMMSDQIFTDHMIISTYTARQSCNNAWRLSGGVSKGIWYNRLLAGLDIAVGHSSASAMRDGTVLEYRQPSAEIKPSFKGSLTRWLSVSYDLRYVITAMNIKGRDNSSYSAATQNLSATFNINDRIQFTAGGEHYHTRLADGTIANMILTDASAVWQISGRVRLQFTARNLLNRHEYRYTAYGTLSRSDYTFGIRPRTILASLQIRF